MKIHKEGWGTILCVWSIIAILAFLIVHFIDILFISVPLLAFCVFAIFFILLFFRLPERQSMGDERAITAVADGEIVVIEKVFENEYLKKECIQVSIYMSFFNMHINFWPISGIATYYKYHPGKYLLAFMPKASELNEHTSVALKNEHCEVFFKQIAGTFARRIVSYAIVGKAATKGTQCGLIKFGSRIDMYLPLDADVKVNLGDKVSASETIIAQINK